MNKPDQSRTHKLMNPDGSPYLPESDFNVAGRQFEELNKKMDSISNVVNLLIGRVNQLEKQEAKQQGKGYMTIHDDVKDVGYHREDVGYDSGESVTNWQQKTKADFGNVTVVAGDVMRQLKNDNE